MACLVKSVTAIHYLPFPKQALAFTCLQDKAFKNTVEKEKLLVTSIFFPYSVFHRFGELFAIFI